MALDRVIGGGIVDESVLEEAAKEEEEENKAEEEKGKEDKAAAEADEVEAEGDENAAEEEDEEDLWPFFPSERKNTNPFFLLVANSFVDFFDFLLGGGAFAAAVSTSAHFYLKF